METPEASGQSTGAFRGLQQVMRKHPLFFFFLMAYAFSWIISIPYVLSLWGILPGGFNLAFLLFALKAFAGPTLAAIIMTSITEGRAGLLRLRHRITQWRAGWQWYLFILVGIPALILLGIIIQPGPLASFQGLTPVLLVSYPVDFVVIFFEVGAARGNRLAWLRAAPHATALWATVGYPAPGCLVGLLAFAVLPDAGSWGRARHQLRHLPHKLLHFSSDGYGHWPSSLHGSSTTPEEAFSSPSCCMPPSIPRKLFGYHSFSLWTRPA